MVASIFASQQPGFQQWTPAQLGASLLGWWDAEDASTLTLSGANVITWTDKKSTLAPTQAVSASRPIYDAVGLNGRPCVTFDGTDDLLVLTAALPFPVGSAPGELWSLVSQDALAADAASRAIINIGDAAASPLNRRQMRRQVLTGVSRLVAEAGDGAALLANIQSSSDFSGIHVDSGKITSTTIQAVLDGVFTGTQPVVPASTAGRVNLGSTGSGSASFWLGKMNSILVTGPLSAGQSASLLAFLKARGGIA